jgi:hypothetical protein
MTPHAVANFALWVQRHPPPSLQELVARFGFYSVITPEAWADFAAARAAWEETRKLRLKGIE